MANFFFPIGLFFVSLQPEMEQENLDIIYMRRCLQLAANGLGRTRPNPLVGCVVVKEGVVLSEGYHQEYGHNHAERNALLRDGDFRGATLYESKIGRASCRERV